MDNHREQYKSGSQSGISYSSQLERVWHGGVGQLRLVYVLSEARGNLRDKWIVRALEGMDGEDSNVRLYWINASSFLQYVCHHPKTQAFC